MFDFIMNILCFLSGKLWCRNKTNTPRKQSCLFFSLLLQGKLQHYTSKVCQYPFQHNSPSISFITLNFLSTQTRVKCPAAFLHFPSGWWTAVVLSPTQPGSRIQNYDSTPSAFPQLRYSADQPLINSHLYAQTSPSTEQQEWGTTWRALGFTNEIIFHSLKL